MKSVACGLCLVGKLLRALLLERWTNRFQGRYVERLVRKVEEIREVVVIFVGIKNEEEKKAKK